MALLKIIRGTQTKISSRPVSDGALLFATDTKKIYLDNGSSRVEMTSLPDLTNYITSTQLSSAIGAEASARQKQDQLLEQAIDDKLGADDIVAGSNVQISHDEESGHITISATDTKDTNTTYTLTKSGSTITLTGSDGSKTSVTDANTTYSLSSFGVTATATELNYMDGVTSNVQSQLNGKAASSHSHSNATTSAAGFLPKLGGGTTNFLRADGTWAKPPDTNTTYSNMTGATSSAAGKAGLVPAPAAGSATRYLRSDGTWQVPPDTNTTYTLSSFGITATAAELNYMDGVTSNVQTQLNGKAASSHNHSAANITSGTLAVARGGTGITSNPSMLVNLGSTSAASVFATSPKPGITGTLAIAHGGTGATSAANARSNIGAAASDIIAVQSTQPSGSTCKLWIQIQSMGISVLFRYAHFYYMQIRFLENKYRDKRSDE